MIRGGARLKEFRRWRLDMAVGNRGVVVMSGASEKGFEAEDPIAEPIGGGMVWDPVRGAHEPGVVERRVREPLTWRDPSKAKVNDQRSRVVMTATGVFLVARLNHWRKWVAVGVGVVDPVCYAEIPVPEADDCPWFLDWVAGGRM